MPGESCLVKPGNLRLSSITLRQKSDRTEDESKRIDALREQIGAKYKEARGLTQEIDRLNLKNVSCKIASISAMPQP